MALRNTYDQALKNRLQYAEAGRPGEIPPLLAELFLPPNISDGRHAFRSVAGNLKSGGDSLTVEKQKKAEADQKLHEQLRQTICKLYRQMEALFDGSTSSSKLVKDSEAIRDLNRGIFSLTDSYLDECIRLEKEEKQLAAESEVDLLTVRGSADCLVTHNRRDSRILLGTSAGGGKTTLLNMIALYYSSDEYKKGLAPYAVSPDIPDGSVLSVRRYLYPLDGTERPLIPCLIRLRDYAGADGDSLESEIHNSVSFFLPEVSAEEIRSRCLVWAPDFILLIDGLDELSAKKRQHFLIGLKNYLAAHPDTPVVLTSRAAALSDDRTARALASMRFQCRSILPLSDLEVQLYAEKWIHRMRPEQEEALLHHLSLIQSERRYAYLREFTRTPLDLLTFLNLLSEGTVAPSRYRMLCESLWEKFTRHEPNRSRKQHLYTDTLNLLGLIAHRMQVQNMLSITVSELDEMRDELNNLNYYSDITGAGTLGDYLSFLDLLAANTGVVDQPRQGEYGFPIRTYQEFLAAHACCHLKTAPAMASPDPRAAVETHAADENWFGVICFLLSDLESSDTRLFRELLTLTFRKRADSPNADLLLPLIDTDFPVSVKDAQIVCAKYFQRGISSLRDSDLLTACMRSGSSGIYLQVLEKAYYEMPGDSALPACGLALTIRDSLAGYSSQDFIRYLFFQREPKSVRLGCFLLHLGQMNPTVKSLSGLGSVSWNPVTDFQVSGQILAEISGEAEGSLDFHAIRLLTDLRIMGHDPGAPLRFQGSYPSCTVSDTSAVPSGAADSVEHIALRDIPFPDGTVYRLLESLCDMAGSVADVYRNLRNRRTDVRFDQIHTVILALGSLPLPGFIFSLLDERREESMRWKIPSGELTKDLRVKYQNCRDVQDFIRFWRPHDPEDRIAWAVAGLLYDGDLDYFRQIWDAEFSEESLRASSNAVTLREKQHYAMIRESVEHLLLS